MTGTEDLNGLMAKAESLGAKCYARIDGTAFAKEGRTIIASVRVEGARGIGPFRMSPVAAAEALRNFIATSAGEAA